MTTWYRAGGVAGSWAYTVRPDLWPAGAYVKARADSPVFADWTMTGRSMAILQGGDLPGVAEAAILTGVQVDLAATVWPWHVVHQPGPGSSR